MVLYQMHLMKFSKKDKYLEVQCFFDYALISPVLTAHPTEVQEKVY